MRPRKFGEWHQTRTNFEPGVNRQNPLNQVHGFTIDYLSRARNPDLLESAFTMEG